MDIILYQNTAAANVVYKAPYLDPVSTISGTLRDECSLLDPIITVQGASLPKANYAYIPEFNRYYFMTEPRSIRTNLWEISLSVDPLYTYYKGILSLEAYVERSTAHINPDIVDGQVVIEQGEKIAVLSADNDLFDTSATYVLNAFGCKLVSS